uniref:Uncharacterized protein n=1 Tax=Anguilla anguilla TaxID=7936 RepID=A0A0E9QP37_ANGAN
MSPSNNQSSTRVSHSLTFYFIETWELSFKVCFSTAKCESVAVCLSCSSFFINLCDTQTMTLVGNNVR